MKRKILLMAMLAMVSLFGTVHAQSSSAPLILIANGNLWAWSEGSNDLRPLAQSRYISEMQLSPDGSKIAYLQTPDVAVQALESGKSPDDTSLPTDIWLVDIASGQTVSIAAQPSDASFSTPNKPDKVIARSLPVWSPDGTKLAWTEYSDPAGTQQLMVDDLTTGQAQAIVTGLTQPYGIPAPLQVLGWTNTGIAVQEIAFTPDRPIPEQLVLLVYKPDGTSVSATPIPETDDRSVARYRLLTDQSQDNLALGYSTGEWDLLDLANGQIQPAVTLPELYSPASPATSVNIISALKSGRQPTLLHVLDAQGNPLGDPIDLGSSDEATAISPDGQTLAFKHADLVTGVNDAFLTVWQGGQIVGKTPPALQDQPFIISSFVWGPTAWRLSQTPVMLSAPTAVFTCAGALPARLAVGDLVQVTSGAANNWRQTPALNGTLIGQIPAGSTLSVSDGPVCADGFVWYQVYYNGQLGWTVESQNGSYALEKVE